MDGGVRVARFDDLQDLVDAKEAAGGCNKKNQQSSCEEYYDCCEHQISGVESKGAALRL